MFLLFFHHSLWANPDVIRLEDKLAKIFPRQHTRQNISLCQIQKSSCFDFILHQDYSEEIGKQHIEITAPKKWSGVQLLHIDHPEQEDPFLLYLPALKKVKKISGQNTPLGFDISMLEIHLSGDESLTWENDDRCTIERNYVKNNQNNTEKISLYFEDEKLITIQSSLGYEGRFMEYKQIDGYLIPHLIQMYEYQNHQFDIRLQAFSFMIENENPHNLQNDKDIQDHHIKELDDRFNVQNFQKKGQE